MLETDDVDDDYFTPVSSTSLSNIFNKNAEKPNPKTSSLKYVAPKANTSSKSEDIKQTKCIFACAFFGYQWSNNVYTPIGKLGLAIVNSVNTNLNSIILYDSNKKTLSYATISSNFEVIAKGYSYISYFDNLKNYWTLYASEEEIKTVIEKFTELNVHINRDIEDYRIPPNHDNFVFQEKTVEPDGKTSKDEKEGDESDTDILITGKTNSSILSRMASIGQAMLPPTKFSDKTSDSSDTNENDNRLKNMPRHKPIKSIVKRTEKPVTNIHCESANDLTPKALMTLEQTGDKNSIFTVVNGQFIPLTNQPLTTIAHSNGNELNLFMSEQRINNSEIRINMNRISDKVDQVLDTLKSVREKDNFMETNFQETILQKLLAEYENKIKMYESVFREKGINPFFEKNKTEYENDYQEKAENDENYVGKKIGMELRRKEESYLDIIKERDNTILKLKEEIQLMKKTISSEKTEKEESLSQESINRVKSIMNDAFQAITSHFESNENYLGATVKNVVYGVLKKVTVDSII